MKECPNCKAILEDDELFCHECGTKQEIQKDEAQIEEVQESGGKTCVYCGKIVEADCTFCPFCGKEQKEETVHEIVAKVPEIVKDHLSRVLLNPGKWIATIIFPNKYPKSAFQLLTNKEDGFVINVALEESRGEGELISRIKQSTFYAKFIVNDPSEKDFFANMKLNSEEDAIKILSGLLHDVYEQSFIAAPRYETDMGEDETVTPKVEIKCKKCIHCGESIEADSMFCPFCGKVQAVEEEKSEEPQQEPVKAEPKQSKASESSTPPQTEQDQPKEESVYEEEEKKSKAWIWILLLLLIAGGAGWYLLSGNNNGSEVAAPVEEVADFEVEVSDYEGPDDEEYESGPSTKLAFLEKFYQEGRLDADYIKQKVTPLVLDRLRKAYGGDCKYGDCLGTWVFLAFPQGADAKIVDGPFISETSRPGIFKVDYVYSYYKDSSKSNETRTVYLTVVKSDGEFLISDFDIEEYNSEENNQSDEETSNGSITMAGKVSDYGIHMVLDVQGADVTGYYYYDSQGSGNRVTLKGSITEGILTLYKYDADGNNTGHFEGAFNGVSYQGRNVNYSRDEALPFSVEIVN